MDAAAWSATDDVGALLTFVRASATERKLRLFACACCRDVWHLLTDARSRAAVEAAEDFADGRVDAADLAAVRKAAGAAGGSSRSSWEAVPAATTAAATYAGPDDAMRSALAAAAHAGAAAGWSAADGNPPGVVADFARSAAESNARTSQVELIRDLFGNPFRPVRLDPRWLAPNVVDLARAIYDGRSFDWLPLLADALQDAGCDDEGIIAHCRGEGPHAKGCWVVDLILGKA